MHFLHAFNRLCVAGGLAVVLAATSFAAPAKSLAGEPQTEAPLGRQSKTFETAADYLVEFYPLWFTHYQSQSADFQSKIPTKNRLIGPDRISPVYKLVVAINVDTLYASSFLDLSGQPLILEIPKTTATYSIMTLDRFGNIFDSGIPAGEHGLYGLTGPSFTGKMPPGVTPVAMPLDFPALIFRVDKHSAAGDDERREANEFRKAIKTLPLCKYLNKNCPDGTPPGGKTLIVPEILFSKPFKQKADALAQDAPIRFLKQIQVAVASPQTPPLTRAQQELSARFNTMFGDGENLSSSDRHDLRQGARFGHQMILNHYQNSSGVNNWIHFTNIGAWGKQSLDRAAITEYIQYGNSQATAAYYHTFKDGKGRSLDGTDPRGYELHFAADELPEASRFWSVTAYTPAAVELVKNTADKYVVASYTRGLRYNRDGSLTIVLARALPDGVRKANWLPVPKGAFNIMLRVYGPEGSVADDTYVPPAIARRK